jgi:hypothetical protein
MDPVYICFFVFCYDIWFYFSNVLIHKFMVEYHNKHPSINYYTYKYEYYFHLLLIQSLGFIWPFIHLRTSVIYDPVHFIAAVGYVTVRGKLRQDNRFVWFVGNHHLLHHKYPHYNFGEMWLDELFDTDYPNKNEYIYGLLKYI